MEYYCTYLCGTHQGQSQKTANAFNIWAILFVTTVNKSVRHSQPRYKGLKEIKCSNWICVKCSHNFRTYLTYHAQIHYLQENVLFR